MTLSRDKENKKQLKKISIEGIVTLDSIEWNERNKFWAIDTNPWKDHELPAFDVQIVTRDEALVKELQQRKKDRSGLRFKVVVVDDKKGD